MKSASAIIVAIFVVVGSSSAFAQRRAPGGHVRLVTSTRPAVEISSSAGVEHPRPTISAARARALAPIVFGARKSVRAAVVERDMFSVDLPDADAKKPFRPRVMPKVMGFPTGGGGVGLKLRY